MLAVLSHGLMTILLVTGQHVQIEAEGKYCRAAQVALVSGGAVVLEDLDGRPFRAIGVACEIEDPAA